MFSNIFFLFANDLSCYRMTYFDLEHTLMIFQLLPFSKLHFSKTIDFCGTQGNLTLSFPIIPNPIVNLVFCSVYVKFKVYATCFRTSFSCLRTAFPVFKHPVPVLERPYDFPFSHSNSSKTTIMKKLCKSKNLSNDRVVMRKNQRPLERRMY
jgi:hypothetical protein